VIRAARDLLPLIPASWNATTRTIDVVWSTGAAVRRDDGQGRFIEELDLAGARLGRLNSGAPFLKVHRAETIADVLGSVVSGTARIERGQGLATIRLSAAASDQSDVIKITEGSVRFVSVGYRVHAARRAGERGGLPVVRVTDWEPMEISAVPIPADAGAHVRMLAMAENGQSDLCYGLAAQARARMSQRARIALAA
jgi:phage head maturation protease